MSSDLPLGKPTTYPDQYAPDLLVSIPRATGREALGLGDVLPFDGVDLWNAYEVSWLNPRGKPEVAAAELWVPATSRAMVESKSLKLYLGSLNGTRYQGAEEVAAVLTRDLTPILGTAPTIHLHPLPSLVPTTLRDPMSRCIDDQEVDIQTYDVDPDLLAVEDGEQVMESLFSHLLKSNCPVTRQPDWATLIVHYRGPRIDPASLLRYVVSYRNNDEFHEHCVERIFTDLLARCRPSKLSVLARYTRRGGIDINPFRSNFETLDENRRVWRQ